MNVTNLTKQPIRTAIVATATTDRITGVTIVTNVSVIASTLHRHGGGSSTIYKGLERGKGSHV